MILIYVRNKERIEKKGVPTCPSEQQFFYLGNRPYVCTITVTFNQAKAAETQYHVAESDLKQELINITSK